jgi:hypothetical protein
LLSACTEFSLSAAGKTADEIDAAIRELDLVKRRLSDADMGVISVAAALSRGFVELCRWVEASLRGEANSERHLTAARAQAVLASEHLGLPTPQAKFRAAAQQVIQGISQVRDLDSVKGVAKLLLRLPMPPMLVAAEDPYAFAHAVKNGDSAPPRTAGEKQKEPLVAKVMLEIDRQPWSTPQVIQANRIYGLSAKIAIPRWPDEADLFAIEYVTTLPKEHYRITEFRIERSSLGPSHEAEASGHIEFPVGQSLLSEPVIIQLRASFRSSTDPKLIKWATVIGYHKLRVRVSDPTRTPLLSKYPALDERIVEVLDEISRTTPGVNQKHLGDFIALLGGVANYMGICLQQAVYKEGQEISEAQFQSDLLDHLRSLLGSEVQEAPKQGGGPTDVQYRSVTAELKVERDVSDRAKMVDRFLNQPTQYSSANGAQLGVLCILDLTPKERPPANPRNNILLKTPSVHGFPEGSPPYPTKIAAVIIDGNLRLPSSYSR